MEEYKKKVDRIGTVAMIIIAAGVWLSWLALGLSIALGLLLFIPLVVIVAVSIAFVEHFWIEKFGPEDDA